MKFRIELHRQKDGLEYKFKDKKAVQNRLPDTKRWFGRELRRRKDFWNRTAETKRQFRIEIHRLKGGLE